MAIENRPCPHCAFSGNPPGSRFCAGCGKDLAIQPAPVQPPHSPPALQAGTLTTGQKRAVLASFALGGLVAGAGIVVIGLGMGAYVIVMQRPNLPPAIPAVPVVTAAPTATLVPTQQTLKPTATNLPAASRTATAASGSSTPTVARTPTAATTPSPAATRATPTMTPDPSWTPPPRTLAKGVPTVQPSAETIYSDVIIYDYLDGFVYQMLGRSDNCPRYASGKGVIYRYRDGVPRWEEERYFLTWVSNPNSQFKIRADDPGLAARQWRTLSGCP